MRKKYILGNWKMNGDKTSIKELLTEIAQGYQYDSKAELAVFPPSIYLPLVHELLKNTRVKWGAQNVFAKSNGAYTGELSVSMLKDFGCQYVLVGHSERRQYFNENEKIIAEKFHSIKEHDMIPVLCVGESKNEREEGLTEKVLQQQIDAVFPSEMNFSKDFIIAYEPVWAIGSGDTAKPEQVQAAHVFIREHIKSINEKCAHMLPIIYGGSLNEGNAHSIFEMPDVDGGLIGGASLSAKTFLEILKCIR